MTTDPSVTAPAPAPVVPAPVSAPEPEVLFVTWDKVEEYRTRGYVPVYPMKRG